jgi:hypothetical protein
MAFAIPCWPFGLFGLLALSTKVGQIEQLRQSSAAAAFNGLCWHFWPFIQKIINWNDRLNQTMFSSL